MTKQLAAMEGRVVAARDFEAEILKLRRRIAALTKRLRPMNVAQETQQREWNC